MFWVLGSSDSCKVISVFWVYLREGYEQQTVALLPAGEAQVAVGGVEGAGRVCTGVGRPHRAGGHLVEPL